MMTMKILEDFDDGDEDFDEDFDDGDNVDIAKVQRPLPIGLFFCFNKKPSFQFLPIEGFFLLFSLY